MEKTPELKFSLIMIGDSTVGKTSLLIRYSKNNFPKNNLSTVGIDYQIKDETIEGKSVKVKIWDTAGQERYKSLTYSFYKNADAIVLVFDVTKRETFENLKNWVNSLGNNTVSETGKQILLLVVGNKVDLDREVSTEEALKFCKEINTEYEEMSAKSGTNVKEGINKLVAKLVKRVPEKEADVVSSNTTISQQSNKKKGCSC